MANIKPFKAERYLNKHEEQLNLKNKESIDKFYKNYLSIKGKQDAIYIYRKILNNRVQIGILTGVAIDDNINGLVKEIQYNKLYKDIDKSNNIKFCNINMGDVLLTYKNQEEIQKIIDYYVYFMPPICDFKLSNDEIHTIWRVEKEIDIIDLIKEFEKIENLYIVYGKSVCLELENIALEERKKNPNYTGEEDYNYYIAMIISDDNLKTMCL